VLIVADTSPLNYLIRIGAIDLLPRLYARVAIPLEVRNELNVDAAPELVRTWIANPPEWLTICSVDPVLHDDLRWRSLDAGEKAAIALASSNQPAIILLDERRGTRVARSLGLDVLGTLGILDEAARRHLISLPEMIERLKATSFRYPSSVVERLLAEDSIRNS
jgi:predicted nucleic acid-binding protein